MVISPAVVKNPYGPVLRGRMGLRGGIFEEPRMRRIIAIAVGAVFLTVVVACAPAGAGKVLYDQHCSACHARGVAGAPMPGGKDVWAPRIAKGMEALYASALNGLNTMPPRGGKAGATDQEIKAAVDYMVSRSR